MSMYVSNCTVNPKTFKSGDISQSKYHAIGLSKSLNLKSPYKIGGGGMIKTFSKHSPHLPLVKLIDNPTPNSNHG